MPNDANVSGRLSDFVLPAGLDRSAPRDVRLTTLGRVTLVTAVALFIATPSVGGLMLSAALRGAAERRALRDHGIDATAYIVRVSPSNDEDSPRVRVTYEYMVGGRTFYGEARIRDVRERPWHAGLTIPVRYVEGRPEQHRVAGSRTGGMPLIVPFLVGGALAACGALCLVAIRRQRNLLMFGRAAPALVRSHKKSQGTHGSHYAMTYDFRLLSGSTATGESGAPKHMPAVGSVISVLYDRDVPRRNRPYPLALVQLPRPGRF